MMLRFILTIAFCSIFYKECSGQSAIRIMDNAPKGKMLGQAVRRNELPDRLQNSQSLTYVLMTGSKGVQYFRIDPHKGKLFANKTIDRDTMCLKVGLCCDGGTLCTIKLQVAIQGDSGTLPDTTIITINIEDMNDNSPQFPANIMTVSIPESAEIGAQYPLDMATDIDSIENSVRRYVANFRPPSSKFKLVTKPRDSPTLITGLFLEVAQSLDREKETGYTFVVQAIDGGRQQQKTGSMTVSVIITDVNDNGPRFKQDIYRVEIKEGLHPRKPLLTVEATDADHGPNAKVIYDFGPALHNSDTLSHFQLDKSTGSIYLRKPLDYETNPRPNFTIIAKDAKGHASTATATVKVIVLNLNDEEPTITINYITGKNFVKIPENDENNRFVAFITVRDTDSDNYGQVSCKLASHENHYQIKEKKHLPDNSVQYQVTTKISLDREEEAIQRVVVKCEDHGEPQNTATAVLVVHVDDENDCTPELKPDKNPIEIEENQKANSRVVRIRAVDRDAGKNGQVTFSIDTSDIQTRDMLKINSSTGVITTRHVIDREATDPPIEKLLVVVVATDLGDPPRSNSKRLEVHIKDVNDNAPYFPQNPIYFAINENEARNYQLGQIHVTDPDKNDQLSLRMDLSYSQRNVPFTIVRRDGNFFLNTTQSLDREVAGEYKFRVIATDARHGSRGHTSTVNVTVTVNDKNDHSPEIIFPRESNNTITMSYKEWKGYELLTVNANDRDKDDHSGKFIFELSSDAGSDGDILSPSDIFDINPTTGTIRVRRSMTASDIGEHWVTVIVRDNGTPSRMASIRCRIVIDRSTPHNRHREGGDQYENYPENIWNEDTTLIFVLVFVLVLLLGIIILFLYIRHWRNAFKFFPDLLVLCDKRSQSPDGMRAKSPECAAASIKSQDPDMCIDFLNPQLCGTMSRSELVKLDKQEQHRRGKLYSDYYMATGRPGSRTLPYKSVNYEVVENVDPSQNRLRHDLDGGRSMKHPLRDDRQRYDLLAHTQTRSPQMFATVGQSTGPVDHFYQTLNLYDDGAMGPPMLRHVHQVSSPSDMYSGSKQHLQQRNNFFPEAGNSGSAIRHSANFKSDPMLNVNKCGGLETEAFLDSKPGEAGGKYENIAKQYHQATLTPGPTRYDRYAMGRLPFDLTSDKDEYAVSFPKVQASFV